MEGHSRPALGLAEYVAYLTEAQFPENSQGKDFLVWLTQFMEHFMYLNSLLSISKPFLYGYCTVGNGLGDILSREPLALFAVCKQQIFFFFSQPYPYITVSAEAVNGLHRLEKSFLCDVLGEMFVRGQ